MLRRIIAATLVTTVTWTTGAMAAPLSQQAAAAGDSYEQAMKRFERFMEGIEELRTYIDRSQFDLDALLEKLDYDASQVVGFVRDEIAFEQYPGLLRGPQGTLMSRAGNALDQAVLLAKLLNDSGYEARIARGTLQPEQSRRLLGEMLRRPRLPTSPGEPGPMREALARMLTELGGMSEEVAQRRAELLLRPGMRSMGNAWLLPEETSDSLIETLKSAGVEIGASDPMSEIVTEATDYYWVEYRSSTTSGWQPVHPVVSSPESEPEVEAEEYLANDVPTELQHRFRVRAFLSRRLGTRVETMALMDPWERPSANLVGLPLTYTNFANGITGPESLQDLAGSLSGSTSWLPLLNGKPAPGAKAFDLMGNTIDPASAATAPAGVIREGASKLAGAAGALAGKRAEEMVGLTRQWVELTLISPGGGEAKQELLVFESDPSSPAASNSQSMPFALSGIHTMMLAVGRYPPAYVLDRSIARFLSARPLLELAARRATDGGSEISFDALEGVPTEWMGHLSLFRAFDQGVNGLDAICYRDRPSLVVHGQELVAPDLGRTVLDIRENSRRAFRRSGETVAYDPQTNLRAGVWESFAEAAAVDSEGAGEEFHALKAVDSTPLSEWTTIRTPEDERLAVAGVDTPTKVAIRKDLAAGYVVLLAPLSRGSWFRVDPRSGTTLARIAPGLGGAITEFIIVVTATAAGTFVGILAYLSCIGNESGVASEYKVGVCGLCGLIAGVTAALLVGVTMGFAETIVLEGVGAVTIPEVTGWAAIRTQIMSVADAIAGVFCTYTGLTKK